MTVGTVEYITPDAKDQAKATRLMARVARETESAKAVKRDARVEFMMALAGVVHTGDQHG